MVNIKIKDQISKGEDGKDKVIDQHATFREYCASTTTLSKKEVEWKIDKLQEELDLLKEVLSKFTI